MTTDTKAVARFFWSEDEMDEDRSGDYVLFADHERVVGELCSTMFAMNDKHFSDFNKLGELLKHRDRELAASRAEVEGLRSLVNVILENRHNCFIPFDDPKAGTFNWDERAAAAMEK